MRKKIVELLFVTLALFLPFAASARQEGSEGGGGANKLIAEYVATANALFNGVPFTPEHKALLKHALERSRITTAKVLVDPTLNQPLPNAAKLIAWGTPGLIQLKEKGVLFEDSFEDALATERPIAHIVIHELFRASGITDETGKSIDENFQLSIGLYHLEQNTTSGSIRGERGSQFLYAECKIESCKVEGGSKEDEDLLCNPGESSGWLGWLNGTLSVYKYAGTVHASQKDGLFSIKAAGRPTEDRLGNEVLDAVKIYDGEKEMKIESDAKDSTYRNFRIEYSTPAKPVTTGHFEVLFSTFPREKWVVTELVGCKTL